MYIIYNSDFINCTRSTVSVTIGASKGQTVLPLPAVEPDSVQLKDKDTVHRLESAVVTWSK